MISFLNSISPFHFRFSEVSTTVLNEHLSDTENVMCVNRQIFHSAFAKVSALSPLTVLLATANICLFLSFSPSSSSSSRLCCCSSSSFFCFLSFRFYGEIIYVGFFLYAFVLSVLNQRTNERNKRVFNLPKSTKFIS